MSSWWELIEKESKKDYFAKLQEILRKEEGAFYPEESLIFNSLMSTPYEDVKVVIVGDEPYIDTPSDGLAFSVKDGEKIPPMLKNIFKELNKDTGIPVPTKGSLAAWAKKGVLLLNTTLTVHKNKANSHKDKGWSDFTDEVIALLNKKKDPVVFILWGQTAKDKANLIAKKHHVIKGAYPAPSSAAKGFFGSKPFTKANELLGKNKIDWKL